MATAEKLPVTLMNAFKLISDKPIVFKSLYSALMRGNVSVVDNVFYFRNKTLAFDNPLTELIDSASTTTIQKIEGFQGRTYWKIKALP